MHVQEGSDGDDVSGEQSAVDIGSATSTRILGELRNHFGGGAVELRGVDSVGPKIGAELRGAAIQAVVERGP